MTTITEVTEAEQKKKTPSKLPSILRAITIPLIVLIVWEILARQGVLAINLFSSPILIVEKSIELLQTGELQKHLGISLQRALIGFGLGGFLGLAFGVWVGMKKKTEQYFNPTLQMIRTVPLLAITPLFILWFGFGELSKVLLIAMGAFFPLYLQSFLGVRNVDNKLFEVAKVLEFSTVEKITKVLFPASLPNILLGLRLSLSTAWMCLVAAELLGADKGVGFMIQDARAFMATDKVFVGIIIFALIGKISDSLVRVLEERLLKWQDSFKA
jgi:sulfonate transport system permease protein